MRQGLRRLDFDELIARALQAIPKRFERYLENVIVKSEARPSRRLLREMGLGPGETLYGVYTGTPLIERTHDGPLMPDVITIFREPLLEDFGDDDSEIVKQIRLTVLHELGHHFGLGDADMAELEEEG